MSRIRLALSCLGVLAIVLPWLPARAQPERERPPRERASGGAEDVSPVRGIERPSHAESARAAERERRRRPRASSTLWPGCA